MPETDNLMHHIKCAPGQLGKYVILPGDPGRVEKIAAFLENPHHVQTYREYTTNDGVKKKATTKAEGTWWEEVSDEEIEAFVNTQSERKDKPKTGGKAAPKSGGGIDLKSLLGR